MEGIQIDKKMHTDVVAALRLEYENEFGDLGLLRRFTREEYIRHYANILRFWQGRLPDIKLDVKPDLRDVCTHAVCSNAISQITNTIDHKNLRADVDDILASFVQLPDMCAQANTEQQL